MRKTLALLLVCLVLTGCGSIGISQEEYDKVVAERDDYKNKYESLLQLYAEDKVDNLKEEIQDKIDSEEKAVVQDEKEVLGDFQEKEPFFIYTGNGDDIVSGVITDSVSYAHIIHNGNGYFSVKGHYDGSYDLLVSTTDPYEGVTLIYPDKEYMFEVSAKGEWTIELFKNGTSSTDSFSGSGDFVTPLFLKTSQVYEVKTNSDGYFSVKGWDNSGYDLLVSTTDKNYSGKVMFKSDEDYAFFEINAKGEWEISPSN